MAASSIIRNVIFRGGLSGRIYFVPRARALPNGGFVCVGSKVDITDQLAPMLLKKYRPRSPKGAR